MHDARQGRTIYDPSGEHRVFTHANWMQPLFTDGCLEVTTSPRILRLPRIPAECVVCAVQAHTQICRHVTFSSASTGRCVHVLPSLQHLQSLIISCDPVRLAVAPASNGHVEAVEQDHGRHAAPAGNRIVESGRQGRAHDRDCMKSMKRPQCLHQAARTPSPSHSVGNQ